jgi:hypothetical protein
MESSERFDSLASTITRHREKMTSCLLILNGWDDERKNLLQRIRSAGITCTPLIVSADPPPTKAPAHWINANQTAQSLLQLPKILSS